MSGKPFIPTDIDIRLGNLIRINRIKMGLSQKDLADIINISFQQIQKYETGRNRISASRLIEIANVLEISVSQLLGKMDKPYAGDKKINDLIMRIYMMPESHRNLVYMMADMLTNRGRPAKQRESKNNR